MRNSSRRANELAAAITSRSPILPVEFRRGPAAWDKGGGAEAVRVEVWFDQSELWGGVAIASGIHDYR